MLWLGIKLANFWFAGWHPAHWTTPVRAARDFLSLLNTACIIPNFNNAAPWTSWHSLHHGISKLSSSWEAEFQTRAVAVPACGGETVNYKDGTWEASRNIWYFWTETVAVKSECPEPWAKSFDPAGWYRVFWSCYFDLKTFWLCVCGQNIFYHNYITIEKCFCQERISWSENVSMSI